MPCPVDNSVKSTFKQFHKEYYKLFQTIGTELPTQLIWKSAGMSRKDEVPWMIFCYWHLYLSSLQCCNMVSRPNKTHTAACKTCFGKTKFFLWQNKQNLQYLFKTIGYTQTKSSWGSSFYPNCQLLNRTQISI